MVNRPFLTLLWVASPCLAFVASTAWSATLTGSIVQAEPCSIVFEPCDTLACSDNVPSRLQDSISVSADPGEEDGEPAPVCATWEGAVRARADVGAAAAAASGGGTAAADARVRPDYTASASTSSEAFISIGGETPIPMGRQLSVDGTPSVAAEDNAKISQTLTTKVGDDIFVSVAAACAAAAPQGIIATTSASSQITLQMGSCEPPPPVTQVPTMSQWSLILTALLLAGLGYVGLRHRQE